MSGNKDGGVWSLCMDTAEGFTRDERRVARLWIRILGPTVLVSRMACSSCRGDGLQGVGLRGQCRARTRGTGPLADTRPLVRIETSQRLLGIVYSVHVIQHESTSLRSTRPFTNLRDLDLMQVGRRARKEALVASNVVVVHGASQNRLS